jgi:hypothetical protein
VTLLRGRQGFLITRVSCDCHKAMNVGGMVALLGCFAA